MYKADVALNRKIAFPLFNTMKVCKKTNTKLKYSFDYINVFTSF